MAAAAEPGLLALVLHAHLPWVRHPEYRTFLEETWLFEAITETYLPLLDVLERLAMTACRRASPCRSRRRCSRCSPTRCYARATFAI